MYAGRANFTPLLFMNVYRIYIFIVWLSSPLCWWIGKKGKKYFESLYICMFIFLFNAYMFMLVVYAKRGEEFWSLCMFSPCLCIHVCLVLCTSLNIFMFIVMHELRGVSMKLNFNPCIYNSMSFVIIKKWEIVGLEAHHSCFNDD